MIKTIWSWKWRIFTMSIFTMAFLSKLHDGLLAAFLNLLGVYGVYALGQFTADEIKKASEK